MRDLPSTAIPAGQLGTGQVEALGEVEPGPELVWAAVTQQSAI